MSDGRDINSYISNVQQFLLLIYHHCRVIFISTSSYLPLLEAELSKAFDNRASHGLMRSKAFGTSERKREESIEQLPWNVGS